MQRIQQCAKYNPHLILCGIITTHNYYGNVILKHKNLRVMTGNMYITSSVNSDSFRVAQTIITKFNVATISPNLVITHTLWL